MGIHYIIQDRNSSEQTIREEKSRFQAMGYRVVVLKSGKGNIQDGLQQLVQNHIQ